jgi:hypothetical protein
LAMVFILGSSVPPPWCSARDQELQAATICLGCAEGTRVPVQTLLDYPISPFWGFAWPNILRADGAMADFNFARADGERFHPTRLHENLARLFR